MHAFDRTTPHSSDLSMAGGGLPTPTMGQGGVEDDGEAFLNMPIGRPPGDRSRLARPRRGRSERRKSSIRPQLYTACIAFSDGPVMLQAFHASVARHPTDVVQRLRRRFGEEVIPMAEIRIGFHPSLPLVIALVPKTVASLIRMVERRCGSSEFGDFVVDIEQRIEL